MCIRDSVNGLPVTTITRTLIDIGKTNRPAVLADAIRDAKRLGVLVPEALEAGAGKSTRQGEILSGPLASNFEPQAICLTCSDGLADTNENAR